MPIESKYYLYIGKNDPYTGWDLWEIKNNYQRLIAHTVGLNNIGENVQHLRDWRKVTYKENDLPFYERACYKELTKEEAFLKCL